MQSDTSQRLIHIFVLKTIFLVIVFSRLLYLQVFYSDHYFKLSEKNRIDTQMIPALRGRITDINGIPIASNTLCYRAYICTDSQKKFFQNKRNIEKILNTTIKLPEQFNYSKKRPYLIKDNLTWEEMAVLEAHSSEIPDLIINEEKKRLYLFPELFSHALGFVSRPNQQDLSKDPFLNIEGLSLGHGGSIEEIWDANLRGEAGWIKREIDAHQIIIRTIESYSGMPGKDIKTTLNLKWQKKAFDTLTSKGILSAGIIVMNVHSGDVHVFLSYPGFNPNEFTHGISSKLWQELNQNPLRPLFNKITQGQYAPGSIFKAVIAACALENKIIDPNAQVFCPGYYTCGNRRFHCWMWRRGGHGLVDMKRAIGSSCDVYFYHLAQKLSMSQIAKTAKKFGFGTNTGLLLFEKNGQIPQESWTPWLTKRANQGEVTNLCIGQGKILSTLLQMVRMTASFANGGFLVKPRFTFEETPEKKSIDIDLQNIETIKNGMVDVINSSYGTARRIQFFLKDGSFGIGGKTGTTQVKAISAEERRQGRLGPRSYEERDHALFVGFAPVNNPTYAIAVIVEHGGWGGSVAAPIARSVIEEIINENQ